tara:strand:+ start:4578 stop:5870 length:1293 start_codon:yes stop_codon:yes gene_type:complete
MINQKYDAIWVKGSFFERGHWKFVPRADSGGGALGAILAVGVVIFIVFCLILTLPLWIALLGFSMVKSKRYYAGIGSVLALLYFFIDVYKNWISGYLLFGYNSSDGAFNEGLFGEKFTIYFYIINGVGTLLALIFIADSELFNETEYSVNKIHTQSNIKKLMTLGFLLIIIGLGFYTISTKIHNEINVDNKSTVEVDTLSNNVEEVYNENQGSEVEFVSSLNDTLPKAKLNVEKVYFYFEPNINDRTSYYFIRESKGMIINYSNRKNGFIYVYNDSQEQNGWMWMLESDFELIDDVFFDKNSESNEVNNKISLGGYYHGGIIFYLDYDGKHGLIRTNTIEKEDGFTWDMAKKASEEYSNDGFDNWYLPESKDLEMIFADKKDNALKDGKYWTGYTGLKNGNFMGYSSSDNSFWVTYSDYTVPMAIFISKF